MAQFDDKDVASNTDRPRTRPFYVIAHHVLTVQGVRDAISHGANAIEADFYAYRDGWWASHSPLPFSAGDTARAVLEAVAEQRELGKTVTMIWFDIKNPDWCDSDDPKWRHSSILGLRDLAREILEPCGVKAMYGFYNSTRGGKAYKVLVEGLNSNEAISLDGSAEDQLQFSNLHGPKSISQRIFCHGLFAINIRFGNTLKQLKDAQESDRFGKTFGWTVAAGQADKIERLLDDANVDGLICGFQLTRYYDHKNTRQASAELLAQISKRSSRYHVACQEDSPW